MLTHSNDTVGFDSSLLDKLRCTHCESEKLTRLTSELRCTACNALFPLVEGRFPDFLNAKERKALHDELEFWAAHFQHVEYQDESEQSYAEWIALMPTTSDQDVLELGCGSGAMLRRMPARIRVGLEPAANLLGPSHGFSGVIGTAHRLPFRPGSFDVVLFKHALHHIQDKALALKEASRVLKPGGRLIVIEPNAEHPQRRLISNPRSFLRKTRLLSRFIGPVETFQPLPELIGSAQGAGLKMQVAIFRESAYDRLTVRQALQKLYSRVLRGFLPDRFLLPNYFAAFTKPEPA